MRYFLTFTISLFLSIVVAVGGDLPFSESARQLLNTQNLPTRDIERLDAFVFRMDGKERAFKKKKNFINYLYDQAHKEIFLSYEQLTSFEDLVSFGKYNCLTGSAFFALLLERYNVSYKVIETNYHMFILIEDEDKQYLLDATDPIYGFETNSVAVEKRVAEYKAKNQEVLEKNTFTFQFDLFNQVNISQLEGLLVYNNSVAAYNQRNFTKAVDDLYSASLQYNSPRIIEMAVLIEGYLPKTPNNRFYLDKIAKIKQKESPLLASN